MFSGALLLLLLLAAGSCVYSIDLIQPDSMVVQPGQSLTITCQVSGYSVTDNSYATGWIRQREGKPMDWICHRWGGGNFYQNDALKNKFSYSRDTSAGTVTITGQNLQPEDTAVYYCVRHLRTSYFDYWGKGTTVTVTSGSTTPVQPTVFPLMPCSSGTGETFTLGCLAKGFTPAAVTFSWTKGTDAMQDFIQYPSVQQGSVYTAVSQVRVRRQDWDNRQQFQCVVQNDAGQAKGSFVPPKKYYKSPNVTVSSSEEGDKATFSCFAKDFSPEDFDLKWLKNSVEVTIGEVQTMPQSKRKQVSGETVYSVASFLTVPVAQMDDNPFTCQFKGKGENDAAVVIQRNSTAVIKEIIPGDQACPESDAVIRITGPTAEDMLLNGNGVLICQVVVNQGGFEEISWEKGGSEVAGSLQKSTTKVKKGVFTSRASITYDEWVSGTKFVCSVKLEDWVEPEKRHYVRTTGGRVVRPSVFMLPPVEHTRKNEVTLTCYVKDFHPQEVFVSWLVDDQVPDSTFDFNTTEPIKSNGLFSTYGQLSMSLTQWQQTDVVYSCAVYHQSVANTTKAIIRSIGYRTFENTNIVNLNMNVPEKCKAQ